MIIKQTNHVCPICSSILQPKSSVYTIDQIFELWKPIIFSDKTIKEHCAQSQYTQLYSCIFCNLEIFLPKIIGTDTFYEELQVYDNQNYYEESKWEFTESVKLLKTTDSVIEIGCGSGNFLSLIKKSVTEVWGIEFNKMAIEIAQQKGLNVLHVSEKNTIKEGNFDKAFSFHVLEHVAEPYTFVEEMVNMVKIGGLIVISVPNQDGPLKFINPCHMNMPPHHATRWHKKTFEVLAEKLNLKIEHISYEPLLLQNHCYYSYYWINFIIPGHSLIGRSLRFILGNILSGFFQMLLRFNCKYFKPLKGQSICVQMRRMG